MMRELRTDDAAPWKQRFRVPSIFGMQIVRTSPMRGLAASNISGVFQLYAWQVATSQLTCLTEKPQGVQEGVLSPDGCYVYYLDDAQGNEVGHFVRVPFEGGASQDITSMLPPYVVSAESGIFGLSFSWNGNRLGCTVVDADGFHLYAVDVGPDTSIGAPRRLYQSKRLAIGPMLSHTGEIAVFASTERTGQADYSLLALDATTGQLIGELWDGPESSVQPVRFSPQASDFRLLATTNATGVRRPFLWNPRSGERSNLVLDALEGEIVPLDWSADGTRLLLCQFKQAVQYLYVYDMMKKTLKQLQHPRGTYWETYFGPEGEIFAQWTDSTHRSQLIALDDETGVQIRTVLATGEVPPSRPWKSVTFPSLDGQTIQGWLAVPGDEGPFPTIVEMHGGPDDVQTEVFSPPSQAWLDHGFAYLAINYRGSTTFGRAFQEQIWGHPGDWEVEDIVAARTWLIEQGIAQPHQVFLTGWSYGGYLTLLALGKHPTLWAGGLAGIAVADRVLQYEDASEKHKGYLVTLFGGTPGEKPEQWARSSPMTYVEQVTAPVFIIQGRNDTRCPARQVEVFEKKMQALGKFIEVYWFDAGHGSFAIEQSIKHQELMLRFAYRVLAKEA